LPLLRLAVRSWLCGVPMHSRRSPKNRESALREAQRMIAGRRYRVDASNLKIERRRAVQHDELRHQHGLPKRLSSCAKDQIGMLNFALL
jgi:hypothetical protein